MTGSGIIDYFDELDSRIQGLKTLMAGGHDDEALLLCCAYLDGLASLRFHKAQEQSHRNFVRLLCEHANDPRLGLIHPLQLLAALEERKKKWSGNVISLVKETFHGSVGKLYTESEISDLVSALLSTEDHDRLANQMWRGALASIIYKRVRCELVHGIGPSISPHCVDLSTTMHDGELIGPLDYDFVHPILASVAADLRQLSLRCGLLFGHGFH